MAEVAPKRYVPSVCSALFSTPPLLQAMGEAAAAPSSVSPALAFIPWGSAAGSGAGTQTRQAVDELLADATSKPHLLVEQL